MSTRSSNVALAWSVVGLASLVAVGVGALAFYFHDARSLEIRDQVAPLFAPANAEVAHSSEPGRDERPISIFFTSDGRFLEPQVIEVRVSLTPQKRVHLALEELLKGPVSDSMASPIPAAAQLLAVYLQDSTVVVDFSSGLRGNPQGGAMAEILCVYAIVQTVLENLPDAKMVRILIEGQPVETLWRHVDLSAPLVPNSSLVRY